MTAALALIQREKEMLLVLTNLEMIRRLGVDQKLKFELQTRNRVCSNTTSDISHSLGIQKRFIPGEADLKEADTNKRQVSEIDTSLTLKGREVILVTNEARHRQAVC